MANYTKTTDFAAKDTLPGGDTNKVVRGSEFETEFDAISTAIATKSDTAGPTFTGTVTIPTADINGGNIDGTVIGASTAAAGTFTSLVATTADINGGTVDGATIGGSSAGAGTFTNLTASGTVNFNGATISNLGTITTANLDGGTVDNAVIGGTTPAAGSFTTLSVSSTFTVNGGAVTATAAELNILDGVTASAAELNILDGKSFVDEDDMSSNSATAIPSQQSVKAYVDSQTGLGGATLAGLSDTNVTSPADAALLFYDTGTSKWIDNVVSGDITIADTGVAAIGSGVIVNADVNASAAIDVSKTALTAGTGLTLSTNTLSVNSTQTLTELDVDNIKIDANAVKSTNTNGNIQLFPNGTGFTELYGNTNAGAIRFNCESNSHGVTIKGPPHSAAATYTLELPNADGSAGQFLKTDGSGKLSFGAVSVNNISGDVDISGELLADSYNETFKRVTSSSNAATVNCEDGNVFEHELSENTTFTFSNPPAAGATTVNGFDLTIAAYDSVSTDVSSNVTNLRGIAFNNDGTKLFVADMADSDISEFTVATAFDLSSTVTYVRNFSVSSQEINPTDVAFNANGTKMFVIGRHNDAVFQYTLSTGFDLSTASYDSVTLSVSSQDTAPEGLTFNSDGTKMYVAGEATDTIYQYTLTTGFDLSTASYASKSVSVNAQDIDVSDVALSSDGTKMFIAGNGNNTVYLYNLSTAFDVSTASYSSTSFSVGSQNSGPNGLVFNNDGTKMYMGGSGSNDTVYQYTTGASFISDSTAYGMSLKIIQDSGASGYTITWPTSVKWPGGTAPTLTATASAEDQFVFYTKDGGTNWYGFTAGQALA